MFGNSCVISLLAGNYLLREKLGDGMRGRLSSEGRVNVILGKGDACLSIHVDRCRSIDDDRYEVMRSLVQAMGMWIRPTHLRVKEA